MVKLKVPSAVGVPPKKPPDDSVMPGGKAPAVTTYVYVGVLTIGDADVVNVWLENVPTVATMVSGDIVRVGGLTVIV